MAEQFDVVILSRQDTVLLKRLHSTMQKIFGEEELDDLDVWEAELTGAHPRCRLLACAALGPAQQGSDASERPVVGGAIWEYFLEAECFLYTYLFLDEEASRGKGLGRQLADAMWVSVRNLLQSEKLNCKAIFVEMHDPALHEEGSEDSMDPTQRVRKMQKMGTRQVGSPAFKYFQPPLRREEGQSLADAEHPPYLLGAVQTKRTLKDAATGAPYVEAETVISFLRAFYHDCAGDDYESDPYFQRMVKSLSGTTQVPLVDFDCLKDESGQRSAKKGLTAKPTAAKGDSTWEALDIGADQRLARADRPLKVVVVGAGFSGLACAKSLAEKAGSELEVLVLEARDRLGGRVHQVVGDGMKVEAGAAWLHGLKGNLVADMLGDGAAKVRTDWRKVQMFGASGPLPAQAVSSGSADFEVLLESLEARQPELATTSQDVAVQAMTELLSSTETTCVSARDADSTNSRKLAMGYRMSAMESENAACLRELSTAWLLEDTELAGGDHMLAEGLAKSTLPLLTPSASSTGAVSVQTGQAVRRVQLAPDDGELPGGMPLSLEVQNLSTQGSYTVHCDAAILTVPIGTLQCSDGISFEPSLPAWKQDAINAVGNGTFNKVALRWHPSQVFWPREAHMFGFNLPMVRSNSRWHVKETFDLLHERENLWIVNMLPVDNQPVLVAMITANLAEKMQDMSDDDVAGRVLAALQIMFPDSVPQTAESIITRWDRDPFAKGSYSFRKTGWRGEVHQSNLVAPLVGRGGRGLVLWAGEATSAARYGYVDGAVETGQREAQRLWKLCLQSDSTAASFPQASGQKPAWKSSSEGVGHDRQSGLVPASAAGQRPSQFRSRL